MQKNLSQNNFWQQVKCNQLYYNSKSIPLKNCRSTSADFYLWHGLILALQQTGSSNDGLIIYCAFYAIEFIPQLYNNMLINLYNALSNVIYIPESGFYAKVAYKFVSVRLGQHEILSWISKQQGIVETIGLETKLKLSKKSVRWPGHLWQMALAFSNSMTIKTIAAPSIDCTSY